jgi:hypothetical protein
MPARRPAGLIAMNPYTPRRPGVTAARLALAALVGGLLGLGGYTFYYAAGLSYFSNDPRRRA